MTTGRVREWRDEDGWGVIDAPETPGGCWAHFSAIVMDGYRALRDGDTVTFLYEDAAQDGFRFRALRVWPPGADPSTEPSPALHDGPSCAYQSTLTLHLDDGRVFVGDDAHEIVPRAKEQSAQE